MPQNYLNGMSFVTLVQALYSNSGFVQQAIIWCDIEQIYVTKRCHLATMR